MAVSLKCSRQRTRPCSEAASPLSAKADSSLVRAGTAAPDLKRQAGFTPFPGHHGYMRYPIRRAAGSPSSRSRSSETASRPANPRLLKSMLPACAEMPPPMLLRNPPPRLSGDCGDCWLGRWNRNGWSSVAPRTAAAKRPSPRRASHLDNTGTPAHTSTSINISTNDHISSCA